jgi:hypothetical protein
MKAKDYADRYLTEGKTKQALVNVWNDIFKEFQQLAEQRHVQTDQSALSIFLELDQKWRAFAQLANDNINPDGFRLIIQNKMPDVYEIILVLESQNQRKRMSHVKQ